MNKLKLFKGIALVNFITLLTIFLLYRNGSFDSYIFHHTSNYFESPNGGVEAINFKDSTRIDSLQRQRLASLTPPANIDNLNLKVEKIKLIQDSGFIKQKSRMTGRLSSSKMGPIFESRTIVKTHKKKSNKQK